MLVNFKRVWIKLEKIIGKHNKKGFKWLYIYARWINFKKKNNNGKCDSGSIGFSSNNLGKVGWRNIFMPITNRQPLKLGINTKWANKRSLLIIGSENGKMLKKESWTNFTSVSLSEG